MYNFWKIGKVLEAKDSKKTRKRPGNLVGPNTREKSHVPEAITCVLVSQAVLTTVEYRKSFFPASGQESKRFYMYSVFYLDRRLLAQFQPFTVIK